jgi:hypothetical protein
VVASAAHAPVDGVLRRHYFVTTYRSLPCQQPVLSSPDDLKRQIARLAASAGTTPHAFMVEALSREAERAELRARFAAETAASEREALAGGKTHALEGAFGYLGARVARRQVRQARASAWRGSK